MRYSTLWVSLLLLFIGGCALKEYAPSEGKLITLKMPDFRFNDVGYVRYSDSGVEVELFSAGQLVEKFVIEENICTQDGCMEPKNFYRNYLHVNYPNATLRHIFRGEPIFQKQGLQKTAEGFKQLIDTDEYNIVYKVTSHSISFKDTRNRVMITIREIP